MMINKSIKNKKEIKGCSKKIGRRIGIVMCLLMISAPLVVYAENNMRKNKLLSKGKIEYEQGKVLIDSDDLRYLADEVDSLEGIYKTTTIDALNSIGTYFCNDGKITNEIENNEIDTEEEKVNLSFGNIKNGILLSQSVDSLMGTQALNKDGVGLYYLNEDAFNNKNMLKLTTEDTGYPLQYQPITADNLTAGTAAWVNGSLIKGNGKDNESSYAQGFIDGQANAIDNLDITYTYHYHEGDATNGGGCYSQVTTSRVCGTIVHLRGYYRGHSCHALCVSYYADDYGCNSCGAVTGWKCGGGGNSCGNMSGQIGGTHVVTSTSWQPTCGYSQGQILTATIVY